MRARCILLMVVFGGACAPRATIHSTSSVAQTAHLDNVPFFPNNTDQCGPSSLASVLNYWGVSISPDDLKRDIYLPQLKGTLPLDMLPAVEANGLHGQVKNGTWDDLKSELKNKRPVIAYLNFGTRTHPIGHFVVVTGYDEARQQLFIHSGLKKDKVASYGRFDRGWKDTGRWILLVRPLEPGEQNQTSSLLSRVPLSTMPERFRATLTAEEHIQLAEIYELRKEKDSAKKEYLEALRLEKKQTLALLGLGNLAFDEEDYDAAENYYRKILKIDPSDPGAKNNLAMVYLAQNKHLDRAEQYAQEALKSPEHYSYACDTLAQIHSRIDH